MSATTLDLQKGTRLSLLLDAGQVLSSKRMDGLVVECTRGSIWITFAAEGVDHVLKPGERLALGYGGRAVIEALETSELSVVSAATLPAREPEVEQPWCDRSSYARRWISALSPQRFALEVTL